MKEPLLEDSRDAGSRRKQEKQGKMRNCKALRFTKQLRR
jgi:hypothetical protein